ncbi:MAG: hypothetical protein CL946_02775 [Ectothiorhodospiraceae bacterium]|nr:hypothetical protein [Ectothiorhodospiraceae bacterium]
MRREPFPVLRIYLACIDAFIIPARYAWTMVGYILGFRAAFVTAPEDAQLVYGYTPPEDKEATWIPASRDAHMFLLHQNPYPVEALKEIVWKEHSAISLFHLDGLAAEHIPSDLVSAVFFFLSQHEEWSIPDRDKYNRFQAASSVLGKAGLLSRPVVYEYAGMIAHACVLGGIELPDKARYNGKSSAIVLTHDIDFIWKSRPSWFVREMLRTVKSRNEESLASRIQNLLSYAKPPNPASDPYARSINEMYRLEEAADIRSTWFFKAGGRAREDIRYSLQQPFVQSHFERLKTAKHEVGIHPSFDAYVDSFMFERELFALESASDRDILSCRQHYLRSEYPETARIQSDLGIRYDSTLGFAEHEGFRNGTCHPFLLYDHEAGKPIPVWEIPLIAMDGTLKQYRGLSPEDSFMRIRELVNTVQRCRGAAALLFHNTIYDPHEWEGWSGVFERTIDMIGEQGIYSVPIGEVVPLWTGSQNPAEIAAEIYPP